ncbi:MAG: proprotein convertase P-domain-containing protein [Deltaproteobacteria bacterium]|nr:proprotein convertase P-domain-containing protein [Deltaproteobacteria bacterium]
MTNHGATMENTMRIGTFGLAFAALFAFACSGQPGEPTGENPFLQDQSNEGKADTNYVNPDGIEVEVDLEADLEAPTYKLADAPTMLGQFALTYLRKHGEFYLESLAEAEGSESRVEWKVDGSWITAAAARNVDQSKLTHWRLRGVNAVLLNGASAGAAVGKVFTAKVPRKPYSTMADYGAKCAEDDNHIKLDQSVYWYLWDPEKSGCAATTQDMTVTVSKMFPVAKVTYPEYDQLVADGKITAVILFGKIGEGSVASDSGMYAFKRMATWLTDANFTEIKPAPLGRRFSKQLQNVTFEIDLYSPADFEGLGDYGHFDNFQKAISEHEIVAYDGHSMLGGSDFFARPQYPSFYQIFLYGGCLGYEYYVSHIINGKGGNWDKVDILSSVVEVSADANQYAAPLLAKLIYAVDHGYNVSWKDLLVAVRKSVGDSTFGVSGASGNCYSPAGSQCGGSQPTGETKRYDSTQPLSIPDNDPNGVSGAIGVPDSLTAKSVSLVLDVDHTYVGDLTITLTHSDKTVTVWKRAGGAQKGIDQTIALPDFAGQEIKGTWTLKVVDGASMDDGTVRTWAILATP